MLPLVFADWTLAGKRACKIAFPDRCGEPRVRCVKSDKYQEDFLSRVLIENATVIFMRFFLI